MEIISVIQHGELDQIGTITFRHDGNKMTLSLKEVDMLSNACHDAEADYVFSDGKKVRCKYPMFLLFALTGVSIIHSPKIIL